MTAKKDVWKSVRRVEQLIEERNLGAAAAMLTDIEAELLAAAVISPYTLWLRAITDDLRSLHESALVAVLKAIDSDPAAAPYWNSKAIIVNNLRAAAVAPSADVPRIWALLTGIGEADEGTHLALARYHVAAGAREEALKILTALATVAPGNAEAWALRVQVCKDIGIEPSDTGAAVRINVAGPKLGAAKN